MLEFWISVNTFIQAVYRHQDSPEYMLYNSDTNIVCIDCVKDTVYNVIDNKLVVNKRKILQLPVF